MARDLHGSGRRRPGRRQMTLKRLAIAAAAGLMLLGVSTAVVLAGQAPGSPSGIHRSAATANQPEGSPSSTSGQHASDMDEQSAAAEDRQGDDEQHSDNDHQGADEQ